MHQGGAQCGSSMLAPPPVQRSMRQGCCKAHAAAAAAAAWFAVCFVPMQPCSCTRPAGLVQPGPVSSVWLLPAQQLLLEKRAVLDV